MSDKKLNFLLIALLVIPVIIVSLKAPKDTPGMVHPNNDIQQSASITPQNVNIKQPVEQNDPYYQTTHLEVHVVSGYEPDETLTSEVLVDRPNQNVVLILSSYDKINWEVKATPTTHIIQIIYSSYKDSYIDAARNIPIRKADLPYAYQVENINFKAIQKYVKENYGKSKIDSFNGNYTIPPKVNVSRLDADNPKLEIDYPKVQKDAANIRFALIDAEGKSRIVSTNGPFNYSFYSPDARLTDRTGKYILKKGDDSVIVTDIQRNISTPYKIPRTFPSFSWAQGMAYSSKTNMVYIASFGGEGYLYKFDLTSRQWVNYISMNNVDVGYMVYDKYNDVFIASTAFQGEICELTLNGGIIKKYSSASNLPGFSETYDSGNDSSPVLSIIPTRDYLIVLKFKQSEIWRSSSASAIDRVWLINRKTSEVKLTYKS